MRIGIFLPNPKEWFGGVNYYLRLCAVLDRYGGNNICCVVFHSDELPNSVLVRFSSMLNIKLIKVANIKQTKLRLLKSLIFGRDNDVYSLIREYKLDFVVENGAYFGWRLSKSVVSWVPDLQHMFLKSNFSCISRFKRDAGFFLQRLTRKKVYLSSNDALQSFADRYRCSKNKLSIVRFSVSNSEAGFIEQGHVDEVLNKYSLKKRFVYFPSQVWVHKNHKLILNALGWLKKNNSDIKFQVVSSGDTCDFRDPSHFDSLLSLIKKNNLEESDFVFLGQIPFEDVQVLMNACEAVINPSLFEGWSTTVEEARSMNKVLLLSDINIHREQAPDNTFYFGSDDVLSLSKVLISLNNKTLFKQIKNNTAPDSFQKKFYNDFVTMLTK